VLSDVRELFLLPSASPLPTSHNIESPQEWRSSAEPMSEASEIRKPGERQTFADNAAFDEAVWQKWVSKNLERDAAHRRKLIRIVCLVFPLLLLSAVVW